VSSPAKLVRGDDGTAGTAVDSVISSGVIISGGFVENSVLSHDVFVSTGARVTDSVLMDIVTVGKGAVVRRAILDKNISVPPGATIGLDPDHDRRRGYTATDSGLTVLSKGDFVLAAGRHDHELVRMATTAAGIP